MTMSKPAAAKPATTDIDWLLDNLVEQAPGVEHVVVLSSDGLLKGHSANLSDYDAEHLSAVASAFHSLASGTGKHFAAGEVRQTVVEMQRCFLLVTAVGNSGCLAVFADVEADLGMVAYETNLLTTQVGAALAPAQRHAQDEQDQRRTA